MNQLRHFVKDTCSRGNWVEEDEKYAETHCMNCEGKKTNRYADVCFSCAKRKAASQGHKLTQAEYDA